MTLLIAALSLCFNENQKIATISLREIMPQDFSGKNLRGRNFKGQNLTGAKFIGADIRGVNFTHAILKQSNFCHAKAGLQRRQAIFLIAVSFFITTLLGVAAGIVGFGVASFILDNINPYFINVAIAIILLSIAFILIVCQGYIKAIEGGNSKNGDRQFFALTLMVAILGILSLVFTIVLISSKNYDLAVVLFIFSILSLTVFTLSVVGLAGVGIAYFLALSVALVGVVIEFGAIALVGVKNNFLNIILAIKIGGALVILIGFMIVYISIKIRREFYLFSYIRMIIVNFAALGGTSFRYADLTESNFSHASLASTDFREATLYQTCFIASNNLHQSRQENPNYSLLSNPILRDLIVTGNGYNKLYNGSNLRGVYLKGANLSYAKFRGADLSGANLQESCLEWANLTQAQAINTDFTAASFTGACLEAWNIDGKTKLDRVNCRFVYLLEYPKPGTDDRERRPHHITKCFEPGDFEKLYKKILTTVEILLKDGINPEAFTAAFQKLMQEFPDITPNSIQAFEKKGDDVLLTLNVLEGTDKGKLEQSWDEGYQAGLQAQRQAEQLKSKDREIEIRDQNRLDMKEMFLSKMTERFNVKIINEVNSTSESNAMNPTNSNNITARDINQSTLNSDISGTVTNAIGQLPASPQSDQPGIKELLTELQAALQADTDLSDDDKAEALEQVKALAEVGQNPQESTMQKAGKTAMKILKGTIASLPSAATLVEACSKLLPAIASLLLLP